jgi:4-hydroxybenzoate polyprenyltransferase
LVAGAAVHQELRAEILLAYAGCVAWTIAYDTIYALQDKEDDALIGVRSTARLFAHRWRAWVLGFYITAVFFWAAAIITAGAIHHVGLIAVAATGGLLIWRTVDSVQDDAPATALAAFKQNFWIGVCITLAMAADPIIRSVTPLFS